MQADGPQNIILDNEKAGLNLVLFSWQVFSKQAVHHVSNEGRKSFGEHMHLWIIQKLLKT